MAFLTMANSLLSPIGHFYREGMNKHKWKDDIEIDLYIYTHAHTYGYTHTVRAYAHAFPFKCISWVKSIYWIVYTTPGTELGTSIIKMNKI